MDVSTPIDGIKTALMPDMAIQRFQHPGSLNDKVYSITINTP